MVCKGEHNAIEMECSQVSFAIRDSRCPCISIASDFSSGAQDANARRSCERYHVRSHAHHEKYDCGRVYTRVRKERRVCPSRRKGLYTLKGHEAELDKLAAETVAVKGTVSGKTVAVESVALAKKG
jgi:hypothetical protein